MTKQRKKQPSQRPLAFVDFIIGVKDNKDDAVSESLRLCGIVVDSYNSISSSFFCHASQSVYEKVFNTQLEYNNSCKNPGYRSIKNPTIPSVLSKIISSVSLNARRWGIPETMNNSHACFRMSKYLR